MQLINQVLFIGILILGLVWLLLSTDRNRASTDGLLSAPQEGLLAPDFSLQTLEGASTSLAELQGQAIVVNFWATWCPPCRLEMPIIQEMFERYNTQGLLLL